MSRVIGRIRVAVLFAALFAISPLPSGPTVLGGQPADPTTLVFIDTANPFDEEVVQSFTPANAAIGVSWDGRSLVMSATADTGDFQNVFFAPPTGEVFVAGSTAGTIGRSFYSSGSCLGGTFEILALGPTLELDVPYSVPGGFEFAASFTQMCGTSEVHGELRILSTEPVSAVALASDPLYAGDLLVQEPDAVAGSLTAAGSITLKNYGTVALSFGAPVFNHESTTDLQISSNTCSSQPLPPSATCTISVRATQWLPGFWTDHFTVPASTARGQLAFRIYGTVVTATLVPIDPVRIVDSRVGLGVSSSLKSANARTIQVRGGAIPADAVAIVGNLTITGNTSDGYAAMTTSPDNTPEVSTINTKRGDTRANGLIVRLTPNGAAAITWVGSSGSSAHAIFDATGYFVQDGIGNPSATWFNPLKSFRIVDTRIGLGVPVSLRAGVPTTFTVPLPSANATHTAIAANVTVVGTSNAGFLSITPTPNASPTTSTLNFPAGDTRANNLIARLGPNRTLSIVYKGPPGSRLHVVIDVTGSFGRTMPTGGRLMGYVPLVPNRVIDTRSGQGIGGKLLAGTIHLMPVWGAKPTDPSRNIPDSSVFIVGAFTGNATIVGQEAAGFITVYPGGQLVPPTTSTVNAPRGDIRANGVIAGDGQRPATLLVYFGAASGRSTHFIFDVTGYFWPGAP